MARVFLTCGNATFSKKLRNSFQAQTDFAVCGEARSGIEAIKKAREVSPDLVILVETGKPPRDRFELAKALKLIMPEVPLFLITVHHNVDAEKEALSHGVDAVFEKEYDFTSLVMNARAVCGLE